MSIWEKLEWRIQSSRGRRSSCCSEAVELAGSFGCSQADTGHLLLAMPQQEQELRRDS